MTVGIFSRSMATSSRGSGVVGYNVQVAVAEREEQAIKACQALIKSAVAPLDASLDEPMFEPGGTDMRFSKWLKFDQRADLRNTHYPGVYAIAISSKNIAGTRFGWTKEIRYLGFTNALGGLRGRLDQFNNTLRDKSGPGHGRAQRFLNKYPNGNTLAKKLYVAVCPFECDVSTNKPKDLRVMGSVVRSEYLAFAKYATLFGSLPEFNDKQKSPKQQL